MNKDELLKDFVIRDPCTPERKETFKWDVYGKNEYCPIVKVTNWWYHREEYPRDNEDYVKAAYNRWGTHKEDESFWKSETMEAMAGGRGDAQLNALKKQENAKTLLSFLSYPMTLKTRKDILAEDVRKILPSIPRDQLTLRYVTTNQSHYKKVHILSK